MEKQRNEEHLSEPSLSIIIPALNEEQQLPRLLHYLFRQIDPSKMEVIVIDGQSSDQTATVARQAGARVVSTQKVGRAPQMNRGAKVAKGRLLYFLHSDTYPPQHFSRYIEEAVKQGYKAGCFRLGFDQDHALLRFYSWFTQFDVNAFRFGDQSLFVETSLFRKIGGFDEDLSVMEDNEIVYRLKNEADFKIMPEQVISSARRYRENGILRLQLIFLLIFTLHHFGASQDVLIDMYKRWIQ